MNPIQHLSFTNQLKLDRKRHEVFDAFLRSDKWFQITYGGDRVQAIVNERRVGGAIYEDWGDGAGKFYATITWWDPPVGYATVSPMLGDGIVLSQRVTFTEDGEATILNQETSAFGPMSDEMADSIRSHGSIKNFEPQLRAWIEKGDVIAPPAL